jgi:hypothetical protein
MMVIQYRLVPPFLHVPESSSFDDEWEKFCCKLLNLEHKTTEIFVRSPPEQGVDIFFQSKKIAYQCKSVESGKPGDFNVTHAVNSYKTASTHQAAIGWSQYGLCANVDLTGSAIATLRAAIPNLLILPGSHWIGLCEKHSLAVERNFRIVVDVQPRHLSYGYNLGDVREIFGDEPVQPDAETYTIFLYSNRHDTVYRLPVRAQMTIEDLVRSMRDLFRLPESATLEKDQISVSLAHSLVVGGRQIQFGQTLSEAGINAGSSATYWTQLRWRDLNENREFRGDVIHMVTTGRNVTTLLTTQQRRDSALEAYGAMLAERFIELDRELTFAHN